MRIVVVGDSTGTLLTGAERQALAVAHELVRRRPQSSVRTIFPLRSSLRCKIVASTLGRCPPIWRRPTDAIAWHYLQWTGSQMHLPSSPATDPVVFVGAGSKAAAFSLSYSRLRKGTSKVVQVLYPRLRSPAFDAILCPKHDQSQVEPSTNAITFIGSLSRLQPGTSQADAKSRWHFLRNPILLVLLGGPRSKLPGLSILRSSNAAEFAERLTKVHRTGSILVSTSRRTPRAFAEALLTSLRELVDGKPYRFLAYDNQEVGPNPYEDWLTIADTIVVTSDSVNMITEAMMTEAAVFIAQDRWCFSKRLRAFHEELYTRNWASPLVGLACGESRTQRIIERTDIMRKQLSTACDQLENSLGF